ncbi:MAG: hypothetical protein DBY30_02755 [Verrucomicrobia bacterium]|nr:MAG: hypothetical protein DBY30_02755 [Verrucomicrobiota bacterium]
MTSPRLKINILTRNAGVAEICAPQKTVLIFSATQCSNPKPRKKRMGGGRVQPAQTEICAHWRGAAKQ